MSWGELFDRARQALTKRSDAILCGLGSDFASGEIRSQSSHAKPSSLFFFSPDAVETIATILKKRFPGQVTNIATRAEKICRHRFDLLGYENLDFGGLIDWHLDPVHRKRAPAKPFHQVPYLNFDQVGDSKVTWELNRHQHLVTLAKAYRLTHERRFSDEIFSQWREWWKANPYAMGINWASSLEVAFRAMSWCWIYHLLDGTPAMPAHFREDWLRAQALNGRHIERYLSTYFSPNTHLLGEAVALFVLGVVCPELRSSQRWKLKGWKIIVEESRRQIRDDGFHFEQSTYYHVYALDFFLHAIVLARANSMPAMHEVEQGSEKMLHALALLSQAGTPFCVGDDDGGRLFDPSRNRAHHLLDPLSTGAALFQREDLKSAARELCEETIWLLGEEGVKTWDALPSPPVHSGPVALSSAGFYFLSCRDRSERLMINAGPQGSGSGGHAHADALSVTLQSNGKALLSDSGTFAYVPPERNRFRGTAMHNTLLIDQLDQSTPRGPFAWERLTQTKAEAWIVGDTFAFFSGSHDGYARLPFSLRHRRQVLMLQSGLFAVRDIIEGKGKHSLEIPWHLGPDAVFAGQDIFQFKGAGSLAILSSGEQKWEQELEETDWAPVYGKKECRKVLKFRTIAELPFELVTLLVPLSHEVVEPGSFTRIYVQQPDRGVKAYLYSISQNYYRFFFAAAAGPWHCGDVESDAEIVCYNERDSKSQGVFFCNGSYIRVNGSPLLTCKRAVQYCELRVDQMEQHVSCSEPGAVQQHASFLVERELTN